MWDSLLEEAEPAAEALLGCLLVRVHRGRVRSARIVETEAYPAGDPASHCFRGRTKRNAVMFGRAGLAYVYRIHQVVCLNVVTGPEGRGEAVLIRAVEPVAGIEIMRRARVRNSVGGNRAVGFELTNGPGKLCQALDVSLAMDGIDLLRESERVGSVSYSRSGSNGTVATTLPLGLSLEFAELDPSFRVRRSPRIGISKACEVPLRFFVEGSPWVTKTRIGARAICSIDGSKA